MHQEIFKHKLAYFTLVVGLTAFVFCFLGFWPNRVLQRWSILGIEVYYFVWGVITHVKSDTLSKRVAAEYAGVAALAGAILLLITL
jgi:hypothetical protein